MLLNKRILGLLFQLSLVAVTCSPGMAQCGYMPASSQAGACPDGINCRTPQCNPSRYSYDSCGLQENANCLCPGAITVVIPRGTTQPGGCCTLLELPTITKPVISEITLANNFQDSLLIEAVNSLRVSRPTSKRGIPALSVAKPNGPSLQPIVGGLPQLELHQVSANLKHRHAGRSTNALLRDTE